MPQSQLPAQLHQPKQNFPHQLHAGVRPHTPQGCKGPHTLVHQGGPRKQKTAMNLCRGLGIGEPKREEPIGPQNKFLKKERERKRERERERERKKERKKEKKKEGELATRSSPFNQQHDPLFIRYQHCGMTGRATTNNSCPSTSFSGIILTDC